MKRTGREIKGLICGNLRNLRINNQKGVALITVLLMTIVVTAIGIAAVNIAIVETRIAANHKVAKQAFYIAEAGLEHARANFDILRDDLDWTDWSDNLPPDWPTSGPIDVGGSEGEYTITARDAALNSIIVTSTGTIAGATSIVEILVERNTLPNVEAALGFVGDVGVSFSYDAFLIAGGADKFGITMSDFTDDDGQSPQSIIGELNGEGLTNQVIGKGANPSVGDAAETSDNISEFVSIMENIADVTISADANGHIDDITEGSVENPKIVYISATKGQDFKGSITGAGILIIEGDDFDFYFTEDKKIDWKGLIIITGDSVGGSLGDQAKNNVKIHGTLIINENIKDEWRGVDIDGNIELIYSQYYLDIAQEIAMSSSWRQAR